MQQIPLRPIPAQSVKALLNGQNCQIDVYQKQQGIFVNISVDGVAVAASTIARDAVPLVSREYAGFSGNLLFIDTQGDKDPDYLSLGSRYSLVYLTAAENDLI